MGYPQAGLDASYSGLCAFDCPHGFCPDTACSTVSAPLSTPTVSPFLPPACIGGTGEDKVGEAGPGMDETVYGPLCEFTCKYGYCPEGACAVSTSGGEGDDKGSGYVYVDPGIFLKPSPVVICIPPCTLIMPDLLLNNPTTIYLSPVATSITLGTTTIKTVYPSPIVTTTAMSYFNMPVGPGQTRPFSFYLTPSYSPEPVTLEADGTSTTIFLPPVSVQSITPDGGVTQTPTSLGTTEYYTNGQTYTYSEAQFPSLSDLATSTITTTTLPAQTSPATSAISTTVVPVWVQAGGFYWSPVPQPTPKPEDIPVPPLPSFPPIPKAPCFKLFDLFSIDCPPNRFLPTTTFTSHAPFPTCTDINSPGCGHRCTSNCGSSSSEKCTAQTATNYWVTCSDTSCSTTKTATFTGCSVTNSATTTGNIPEIAVVGGDPYTVTGGTINVDGTTIRVPNVDGNEQVSTTIDNVPMVIIPSYSGTVAVPVFPTAKPTSDSGSHSTTSSTTTSTTTTTTSSAKPAPTSADGCDLMKKQGVCWNKCDPITGKAVGGGWKKGDPWCWLEHDGVGAFCNHQTDCPTTFQCQPSIWAQGGCTIPEPDYGGCAIMDGIQGVCWSKCNPKTSQPVKEEWNAGDPWCWLKTDQAGAFCNNDKDCPADLECQPSSWAKGGCSASTPIAAQLLSFHTNGTSAGPLGLGPGLY
ncbi:unnamed protein product [Aspergillus oryzae]|nr:unnamed protein product [Aspergillus oryzae]GMF91555.1 unnamed protein product [Aspergillus oryzae]